MKKKLRTTKRLAGKNIENMKKIKLIIFTHVQVVLDLWEHLEMCKEGQMSWLSRQLDEANFIITVCSKGLRYSLYPPVSIEK